MCIASVPSTLSLREIAERETRQRSDSSRTDHLSKARAARSWAPLIGELEIIRFESPLRPFPRRATIVPTRPGLHIELFKMSLTLAYQSC
jgi:hypothetical protein